MEAEVESLMGAKSGVQMLCHLRYRAGKCPQVCSGGKVSHSSSTDLSPLLGKRGRTCVCLHRLNTVLTTLFHD